MTQGSSHIRRSILICIHQIKMGLCQCLCFYMYKGSTLKSCHYFFCFIAYEWGWQIQKQIRSLASAAIWFKQQTKSFFFFLTPGGSTGSRGQSINCHFSPSTFHCLRVTLLRYWRRCLLSLATKSLRPIVITLHLLSSHPLIAPIVLHREG